MEPRNYIKERMLGKGSFGTVYLIRPNNTTPCKNQEQQHGYAVLKEIKISDEEQRSAAHQEAGLLSQLHHPNIIRYLHSFEAPDNANILCLVMEYCPGGDLQKIIRQRRGVHFPEPQIIQWFHMLASALDYLHQRKILHRDIKTGNIFASQDGKTLKLGDFGAAKVLERTGQMARTCVGTPTYLSPEICGRQLYDSKSDVWSLGCVLYQTMTLRPPFAGRNLHQLLASILRGHFLPMPSRYSYELRTTVGQMLRKNPEERPSAEALLRKRFFSSQTNHRPPIRRVTSAPPAARLNRKALGSLAVYASPLLPRQRPASSSSSTTSTSISIKKNYKKKASPRRRWNLPTETLISALSSLGLSDGEEESKLIQSDDDTLEDSESSSIESPSTGSLSSMLARTCILNTTDSVTHQLERWAVSMEEIHGVHQLKEVNRRLNNVEDPEEAESIIRSMLMGQIPESALTELVEFFRQQYIVYR